MIISEQPVSDAAIADHYDELDSFYRDIWGQHVHHGFWLNGDESSEEAVRKLVELVAQKAELRRDERVIDIGCGYGASARLLAENYGAAVTAITMSAVQYAFAQSIAPRPELTYILGNWYSFEFASDSFDLAIAIESGEHMPDKVEFARRAYRVLRPGGRFVLCAWLSAPRVSKWQTDFPDEADLRWRSDPEHCDRARVYRCDYGSGIPSCWVRRSDWPSKANLVDCYSAVRRAGFSRQTLPLFSL